MEKFKKQRLLQLFLGQEFPETGIRLKTDVRQGYIKTRMFTQGNSSRGIFTNGNVCRGRDIWREVLFSDGDTHDQDRCTTLIHDDVFNTEMF